MSRRGRKPHTDPPREWKVSIPGSLADKIEILLADPLTGVASYGSRSALIQALLQTWVDSRQKQPTEIQS